MSNEKCIVLSKEPIETFQERRQHEIERERKELFS
jgi:hypothetical protein